MLPLTGAIEHRALGSDDPVECAVITLQNWWKDMLVKKLDWSVSSKSSLSSRRGLRT